MAKDEAEIFLQTKEDVLNNLAILHFNLEKAADAGIIDVGEELYNRIEDLIEAVNLASFNEELEAFVENAKAIEIQIDAKMISAGEVTVSLTWPDFR